MTFELLTPTDAKLASFNIRNEKHGEDDVLAFSMGLKITTANTFLDGLAPGLRESLFMAVEGQEQLPGVEPATPLLRCKGIGRIELAASFEGWTLAVPHGLDEETPITVGGCRVDKWRVVPFEGGSVEVSCRIGSNDVDETELGKLGGKLGQVISLTLTAPKFIAPADVIDGTVEAFEHDHPEAGDLFAAAHQDDAGGPHDSDTDSGADSEGGQTDVGSEVAEFEQGVKAAVKRGRGRVALVG